MSATLSARPGVPAGWAYISSPWGRCPGRGDGRPAGRRLVDELHEPSAVQGLTLLPMGVGKLSGGDPAGALQIFPGGGHRPKVPGPGAGRTFLFWAKARPPSCLAGPMKGSGCWTRSWRPSPPASCPRTLRHRVLRRDRILPRGLRPGACAGMDSRPGPLVPQPASTGGLQRPVPGPRRRTLPSSTVPGPKRWKQQRKPSSLRHGDPQALYGAFVEEGDIQRVTGNLDVADASYPQAARSGYEAQPGLSLLALARGEDRRHRPPSGGLPPRPPAPDGSCCPRWWKSRSPPTTSTRPATARTSWPPSPGKPSSPWSGSLPARLTARSVWPGATLSARPIPARGVEAVAGIGRSLRGRALPGAGRPRLPRPGD